MKFPIKILILVLVFVSFPPIYGQGEIFKILPTDDVYVVTDANDPLDSAGLRDLHTGDLEFLKMWYANNATENQEVIYTIGYLKFDLSELNDENFTNAKLKMKSYVVNIVEPRTLSAHFVPNTSWDESDVVYNNKPGFNAESLSINRISTIDDWYSWDVTDTIKLNMGSQVSFALIHNDILANTEEQVVFYSKETDDAQNIPYLEIDYSTSPITSLEDGQPELMLPVIIGGLIGAVVGVGILFYLMKRTKSLGEPTKIQSTMHSDEVFSTKKPMEKTSSNSSQQKSSPLKFTCKSCGKTLTEGFRTCPYCGKKVDFSFI